MKLLIIATAGCLLAIGYVYFSAPAKQTPTTLELRTVEPASGVIVTCGQGAGLGVTAFGREHDCTAIDDHSVQCTERP